MTELFYAAGLVSIIAVLFSVLVSFRSGQPLDRDFLIIERGKFVSPSYSYAFK